MVLYSEGKVIAWDGENGLILAINGKQYPFNKESVNFNSNFIRLGNTYTISIRIEDNTIILIGV